MKRITIKKNLLRQSNLMINIISATKNHQIHVLRNISKKLEETKLKEGNARGLKSSKHILLIKSTLQYSNNLIINNTNTQVKMIPKNPKTQVKILPKNPKHSQTSLEGPMILPHHKQTKEKKLTPSLEKGPKEK